MGGGIVDDLEKAFLESPGDSFAIYQLKHTQETRDLRFASMNQVLLAGKTIDREKYSDESRQALDPVI